MARHKDLKRAHAVMDGTQWHIENEPKSDQKKKRRRRDKRSCVHYMPPIGKCRMTGYLCHGSNTCLMYRRYVIR